ncbi:MAG: DUF5667 domain-containing protein [Patescibacteria group bacterium]
MKDNRFNKAIEDLKHIRMTDTEKNAMRARIVAMPVAQSEATPRHVKSPWSVYTFNTWVTQQRWVVASLALVIIIGSGGVVSAAERALPGSVLYPIKVDIVEPLRDTLTVSSEGQANWNAEKAERRIEEASVLATTGKLDDTTQAEIETRLDQHTRDFDRALQRVREEGAEDRADEISVAFQAGLGARAQVLEVIAENDAPRITLQARSMKSVEDDASRSARQAPTEDDEDKQDKRIVVASLARSRAESLRGSRSSGSVAEVPVAATMSMMMSIESAPTANEAGNVSDASVAPIAPQPQVTPTSSVQSKKSVSQKDPATYTRRKASTDKMIADITARITKTKVAPGSLQGKLFDTTTRNLDEARAYIRQAEEYQDRGQDDEARTQILEAERAAKEAELLFKEGVKSKKSGSQSSTKESVSKVDSKSLTGSAVKSLEKNKKQSSGKIQIQKKDREDRGGNKGRDFRKND